MKEKNEIGIRVCTNAENGFGHIARQLSVREHFAVDVVWFTDPHGGKILGNHLKHRDKIFEESDKSSAKRTLNWAQSFPKRSLIFDTPNIFPSDLTFLRKNKTHYFSDYSVPEVQSNITVVNSQPNATGDERHLLGPKYLPINGKKKSSSAPTITSSEKHINCLVGFGAVDSQNMTTRALDALLKLKNSHTQIIPVCLLGAYSYHRQEIKKKLNEFDHSICIENCSSILALEYNIRLAIGAPGISHAERLYLGIPTVLVAQSKEQINLCKTWSDLNCGLHALPDTDSISQNLEKLVSRNFCLAETISDAGRAIVDGKGAERIATDIKIGMNA